MQIAYCSLLDKIYDFKVLYDWDMTSDHYPVQLKQNFNYISINQASFEKFSYDFNRADWVNFKSFLCNSQYEDCSDLEFNYIEAIPTVRFILKLKCDTPSNIVHHEALNKLKLLTISNLLFELSERYVAGVLRHSVPMVVKLVDEYKADFESRYVEYPTPLCNCYLTISSFFPELIKT
ncbi:hypothetical protein BpHYR1_053125 [Brachionus plicatilis]|uniref:RNA-directed DNA polymerase from mobile element jockey-like n=1 Tax=Brachionus plicatilis TaxID=10195 RepID=A0A3M7PMI8_BRAPC|nr:hypothetical protein BpHYR1_053125 [Brachionus plicatilis]